MRPTSVKIGRLAVFLAGPLLAAVAATSPAHAAITGTLTCNVAPGVGAIVVSQRSVSCTFQSSYGPAEFYNGSVSRLGVDIGSLNGGQLVYQVVAAGLPGPGALAGTYVGPGFGVTVGAGIGLDGLVGGNGNTVSLQPVAATTNTGLDVNAGVGALSLTYAGPARGPMHRHHHRNFYRYHHHHHM